MRILPASLACRISATEYSARRSPSGDLTRAYPIQRPPLLRGLGSLGARRFPAGSARSAEGGAARDAALAALPARKGRRAGQPVQPSEIPFTATRRAVLAAIRSGKTCYTALTSAISRLRTVIDRNRHRARKAKYPSTFEHARRADTATRTAPAIITLANKPA